MLKSNGPRIDPWGTPDLMSLQVLYEDFTFVLCFRFER